MGYLRGSTSSVRLLYVEYVEYFTDPARSYSEHVIYSTFKTGLFCKMTNGNAINRAHWLGQHFSILTSDVEELQSRQFKSEFSNKRYYLLEACPSHFQSDWDQEITFLLISSDDSYSRISPHLRAKQRSPMTFTTSLFMPRKGWLTIYVLTIFLHIGIFLFTWITGKNEACFLNGTFWSFWNFRLLF